MPLLALVRLVLVLAAALALAGPLAAQELEVFVDRELQAYAPGETIVFKVRSNDLRGNLDYRVRYGSRTPILVSGTVRYDGGTFELPYTPEIAAGFINFEANLSGRGAAVTVAVGRDSIGHFFAEPADFDAFWASERAALAAVPMDLTSWVDGETQYSTTYQFSAGQIDGRRVFGYIVVPKGTGPFPAALRLPPFGEGPNLARPNTFDAENANLIAATITIHNAPPGQRDPRSYQPEDLRNRETIYYRYAVLAAIRAIDVIAARPEWNRRDLLVYGDSQGGGLAMLVAGIDSRATHLVQSVAALNRHGSERLGRPGGFPYYYETAEALYSDAPGDLQRAFEAIQYYDAVYAARRFAGPSLHFVNYLDPTCPPATVYAGFNEMRGPKAVLHSFDAYHANVAEFTEDLHDFTRVYLPAANQPPFPFSETRKGYLVEAGPDLAAVATRRLQLRGFASYDGQAPGADWRFAWEKVSGPGEVTFDNAATLNTGATFSTAGAYRLRLSITDPYPEQPRKYWLLVDELTVYAQADTTATLVADAVVGASLRLSPNPAHDRLTVVAHADVAPGDAAVIELTDALGRTARTATVVPAGDGSIEVELPVRDLARGTYTLTVGAAGRRAVSRAVSLQ